MRRYSIIIIMLLYYCSTAYARDTTIVYTSYMGIQNLTTADIVECRFPLTDLYSSSVTISGTGVKIYNYQTNSWNYNTANYDQIFSHDVNRYAKIQIENTGNYSVEFKFYQNKVQQITWNITFQIFDILTISDVSFDKDTRIATVNMPKTGSGDLSYFIDGGNEQSTPAFSDCPLGQHTFKVRDNLTNYETSYTTVISEGDVEISTVIVDYDPCGESIFSMNLSNRGSGDLYYNVDGGLFQKSNVFANIPEGIHTVGVKDNYSGVEDYYDVYIKEYSPYLDAEITNSDCSKNGGIDISLRGIFRYMIFEGNDKIDFTQQLFEGKSNFCMEGIFRITEDFSIFQSRSYVSLFGQNNCIGLGFKNGKPSFYLNTDKFSIERESGNLFTDDGNWHHIAYRGNGTTIDILIDGVVIYTYTEPTGYGNLISAGMTNAISIGNNVWGNGSEDFIGHIRTVSFWDKPLTNAEINNIMNSSPSGNEMGLLAAYNPESRESGKIPAVKGEDGIFNGVEWSDNGYIFTWKDSEGNIISNNEDIFSLDSGSYTINVDYSVDCNFTLNKTYSVKLTNNLTVSISSSDTTGCDGREININSSITGGVGNNVYVWEISNGAVWDTIPDEDTATYLSSYNLGKESVRLKVTSNICTSISEPLKFNLNTNIDTKTIVHKK